MIDRESVGAWLSSYIAAWKSYDREAIGALFSADVEYRYHPYDQPIRGRDAVVESWLGDGDHESASSRDEQDTYDASYEAVAVDGDLAVVTGTSTYLTEPGGPVDRVFDNCFVIRFDAQRLCREFTEWFIERPRAQLGDP